jgi:hypothetical protein
VALLLDPAAAVLLLLGTWEQRTFVDARVGAMQQAIKVRIRKYPDADI